jgi:broad specificity phosphatase PhoE
MRLVIVRHGETEHNAKGILMGHQDIELSASGINQARIVAQRLKEEHFDIIYCSDLRRCKNTLDEIVKFHNDTPVVFSEELRERNMGVFEGGPREKLHEAFNEHKGDPLDFKPEAGESVNELFNRARSFFELMLDKHKNESVLVITHGGIMRCLDSLLTQRPLLDLFNNQRFYNTAVCEYEISDKKTAVRCFNDANHLSNSVLLDTDN